MTDDYMVDVTDTTGDELDGPTEVWIVTHVEQGIGMTIHPDFIGQDETIEEFVEKELENQLGDIAREIADGIRESDVTIDRVEKEDL